MYFIKAALALLSALLLSRLAVAHNPHPSLFVRTNQEPLKVDGPQLALNVDTAVLGQLGAGLLDAEGKMIEGFGPEEYEILRINSARAVVKWKRGSDQASLKGRDVRLIFTGSRAGLYSFYFTTDSF